MSAAPPPDLGLRALQARLAAFRAARAWAPHHTPRNLLLALVGEVGELAELFQWRPDADAAPGLPGWSDAERARLGEEVSDVLLYLLQLADACGVDLVAAVPRKIAMNARKYPPLRAGGDDGGGGEEAGGGGEGGGNGPSVGGCGGSVGAAP